MPNSAFWIQGDILTEELSRNKLFLFSLMIEINSDYSLWTELTDANVFHFFVRIKYCADSFDYTQERFVGFINFKGSLLFD